MHIRLNWIYVCLQEKFIEFSSYSMKVSMLISIHLLHLLYFMGLLRYLHSIRGGGHKCGNASSRWRCFGTPLFVFCVHFFVCLSMCVCVRELNDKFHEYFWRKMSTEFHVNTVKYLILYNEHICDAKLYLLIFTFARKYYGRVCTHPAYTIHCWYPFQFKYITTLTQSTYLF